MRGSGRCRLVLGLLLVELGLGVVLGLVELVADGVLGSLGACSERSVSVALGNLLVALLLVVKKNVSGWLPQVVKRMC